MSLDVLVRYFLIPGIGLWAFWRLCIEGRELWRETRREFDR